MISNHDDNNTKWCPGLSFLVYKPYKDIMISIYIYISEMSFSDTSSEREINQEEYIKQKILSCKCSEYATIKWITKNIFTDGIGNKICEYVACKSCSNIMSHFDSIEIDIYPCDDEDIDEQIQIYVYNTLVNEIPDDKMNLVLNEKEMRHYQDYGQGLKHMF